MYKVLIVEDDPMVAMINEQYVNRNKMFNTIKTCKDGKSALDFLQTDEVDLIILDVYMPYMNGIELLKEIRRQQIPVEVIMVTAANDTATLEETIHLGVVDYLVKPFAFDRFQIALEKFAAQVSALSDDSVLNQKKIDSIIENSCANRGFANPKGIQEKTLNMLLDFINSYPEKWFTVEQISEAVGLSIVTVRRYLVHLVRIGDLTEDINYETGGRPCSLYKASLQN